MSPPPPTSSRCAECGSRLAADQRYCLTCGARRGPLPASIAGLLASLAPAAAEASVPATPIPARAPAQLWGIELPGPRAAAVAVMGMLAFGVMATTGASPALQNVASAPLRLIVDMPPVASAPASEGASASGSAGAIPVAEQVQQTITITTPAPAGATPTPTPQPAITVIENPSPTPASGNPGGGGGGGGILGLPPIKHVFLIVLSNNGYRQSFGPASADRYLSHTLARQGELIQNYYSVAGSSLANAIALVSGQGPTVQTASNCPVFSPISPFNLGTDQQVVGSGCVYPASALTLADQLTGHHHTWRAYVEGIDSGPAGQPQTCRHPPLGASDPYQVPRPTDPYVTWRNPFVYFSSLTAQQACNTNDVGLDRLSADLEAAVTTPSLSYIVPGPCDDGDPQPCRPGAPAGLPAADTFLRTVVPEIEQSPAYQADGLIAVTFDQAPQSGANADPSACCNTPPYPNLPAGTPTTPTGTAPTATTAPTTTSTTPTTTVPTSTSTTPATTGTTPATTTPTSTTPGAGNPLTSTGQTTPTGGGGQAGLLLISRYVKPGSVDLFDFYNHYSLLASIENLFGLPHLGFAGAPQLPVFDAGIFNHQS